MDEASSTGTVGGDVGVARIAPDDLPSACLSTLADLSSALRGRFAAAGEPFGIPSVPAWRLLIRLDSADGPQRPSDLASEMHLTRGALTQMLQTLERRGLVERIPDPDDGRGLAAVVTGKGRESLNEFTPRMRRREREITNVLDDEELQSLHGMLHRLRVQVVDGVDTNGT